VCKLDGAAQHRVSTTFAFVAPRVARLRYRWLEYIDTYNIKAFAEVGVGPTGRTAAQNLTMVSGLGGMKPNTVILPFPEDTAARIQAAHNEFIATLGEGKSGARPNGTMESEGKSQGGGSPVTADNER